MAPTPEQVEAGHRIYTKATLPVYDFVVLSVSCRFIWQCPAERIRALYGRHLSANHLEAGVGTGYFLDHCPFPSETPRIALLDINQHALEYTARRIARYHPEVYCRNILDPISMNAERFDSVAINAVFHCIPGSIESKAAVLDHLKALMNPGAVIFGSTLLNAGIPMTWRARQLMRVYNRKGIFSNRDDHLDGLSRIFRQRFQQVKVEVVGCNALFTGVNGA